MSEISVPKSVIIPSLTNGVLKDIMVGDHEITRNHACSLLPCYKSERIGVGSEPPLRIIEIVLEVGAKSDAGSYVVVALRHGTSVAGDQSLLKVFGINGCTPEGAYGYRSFLCHRHLRDVFVAELQGTVLLIARG